jgi:PAS domain S-box-containing protein
MDVNKLLKLSVDLICTVDSKDHFVDVSEASYAILGYYPHEMRGRAYQDFIYPGDLADAGAAVAALINRRPDTQIQMRYLHKDGHIVPLLWCVQWDVEDQLMYCIARNGSITEQTETMRTSLEESNLRYQYVTRATSDAIWDWNLTKGTLYWGEGFETIFGYDRKKLSGTIQSWTQHVHPEDSDYIIKSIVEICTGTGTNWKEEYRYKKADGTYADVVDRGFVIRDEGGTAVRMVGAMHDISERKKALFEMRQVTAELFKQNRELHEFGYIVSHNLRAPVANIKGIAMLMKMEAEASEALVPYLDNLGNSIANLDEVIIDLSKILSSKNRNVDIRLEPLDLHDIIQHVKKEMFEKAQNTNFKLIITGGPFIVASYQVYLYSIFFNLISNSIKFRQEVPLEVDIAVEQTASSVLITYQDNGCGIDLERYKEEIFKPYKAFHATIKGKGLGLFLIKNYIEALGGSIEVESSLGKGTTYLVILPKT